MKPRVLHLIRKKTQLKASFIQNQVISHLDFEPYVVFRFSKNLKSEGGFSEIDINRLNYLDLSVYETFYDNLIYFLFNRISHRKTCILKSYIERNNIKVLHFHYGSDAGIFVPLLKATKLPSVVSFYGYDSSGFAKRNFGLGKLWLRKRVFNYATRILAMSPDMKNDLLKSGCPESKIIVHYYGTDVQKFYKCSVYKDVRVVRFLIISGLVPQKGHKFLLGAFEEAYKKNKNMRLTIVGAGPMRDEIAAIIEDKILEDIVKLEGPVKYNSQEHIGYLKSHDVFIHPSITDVNGDKEGIPGTIVEAMASGLPVISTYHAGIPYIIENEVSGLLVNEWDVNALTDSILRMADSVELRKKLGKSGQAYALNNLNLKIKELDLENIYRSLIKD